MLRWLICGSIILSVYAKDEKPNPRLSIFGRFQNQSPSGSDNEGNEGGDERESSGSLKHSSSPAGVHFKTPSTPQGSAKGHQFLPDGNEPAGHKADRQVYPSLTPKSLEASHLESGNSLPHPKQALEISEKGGGSLFLKPTNRQGPQPLAVEILRRKPPNNVDGLTVHVASPCGALSNSDEHHYNARPRSLGSSCCSTSEHEHPVQSEEQKRALFPISQSLPQSPPPQNKPKS